MALCTNKKCGEIEIFSAVKVGKNIYALNCIFCKMICLQLETFVEHLEEKHQEQLELFGALVSEREENEDYIEETVEQHNEKFTSSTLLEKKMPNSNIMVQSDQLKYADLIRDCNEYEYDPLEESMLIMPITLESTKIKNNVDVKQKDDLPEEQNICNSDINDIYENQTDDNLQHNDDSSDTESDGESTADDTEFDDNKDITLAIIAGYERHRVLWDDKEPLTKNRKKREEAFKEIASSITAQHIGNTLEWKTVGDRIKKLRYKFRSELQNQKLAKLNCENEHNPPWYYEKLEFLNATIKYKQRNKRGAKALANEKPSLPLPNLTEAQNRELIGIYKNFPCLWNVEHIGFRFKNQRQDALDEMLAVINKKFNLKLTQDELQKKLYRIRYACTQEKHRQLQCERLQKDYKPSCKFYAEISFLENNVGPFKCAFCEKTFNGADQYKIHKATHDGSMPFTCPLCNRGFMKVGNCTVHLRRHTRDYPFDCKVCGKRFATTTDVNVHMRHHTGEKPYFCDVCGQSFRTWTFFDAHMRRHQKRPSHKCDICSKSFYENNKLTEHMKAHLNVRDKICNVCGKAFTSSKYLRQHKQIHAEKKKYVCQICGKNFAQYAGLSGHKKSHGNNTESAYTVADDQQ